MKTVAFHNLGCKVNSYEIEVMQQNFEKSGYIIVPFDTKADIYVINTCTVTNIADRKSRQMLHRAKKANPDSVVVATGCYVQTNTEQALADEAIDICIGNNRKNAIVTIVEEYIAKRRIESIEPVIDINHTDEYETMTLEKTAEHVRAYIKIQDGCNQFCTYCAIPYARGRVRSRHSEEILAEVRNLCERGYKEFVLTGIHISSYGMDFIGKNDGDYLTGKPDIRREAYEREYLLNLIKQIDEIPGVKRIRLGSLEPRIVTDRFVSELSQIKSVCPHFHLSLQSGCDETLRRMNRRYTSDEYYEGVELLRRYYDHPAITTDIITGFPGETDEEFAITEKFTEKVEFYETHLFKYSKRQGTVADKLPNQNTEAVKAARSDVLMKINIANGIKYREYYIGRELEVLIEEEKVIGGKKYMVGHTPNYIMCAVAGETKVNEIVSGRAMRMLDDETIYIE